MPRIDYDTMPTQRRRRTSRSARFRRWVRRIRIWPIVLALVVAAMVAWPFIEARMLWVDEKTLYVQGLPDNLKNLRVVFVTDIHQGPWMTQERVDALVRKVNDLSADVIVLGGDYANDSNGAIDFFANAPGLRARFGVFGVVGNHDRTVPESNLSKLVAQMQNYGCTPLVNAVGRVKVGQTYLYVAGVDDYYNGIPDVQKVAGQLRESDFVIFAGHSPDLMDSVLTAHGADGSNHWFDLALFGHTHGGQVNLFGYTPFGSLRTQTATRYRSGWFEENRAAVLVSNGVGTSVAPVRLLCPPQIHVVTLKKK